MLVKFPNVKLFRGNPTSPKLPLFIDYVKLLRRSRTISSRRSI